MKLNKIYIYLLAICLFLVRYWDIIFSYKILGNGNDSVHLLGPVFKHTSDLMISGQTPLFFQGIIGGVPFYNSAMYSFTYPFYFFGLINYGNGIEVLRTITLVIVFHFFLLFISNIILLRVIGFGLLTSVLSAFSVILCLNTAYNSPWIIAIAGYALIPLFFAGIISMLNSKSNYNGILLISVGSMAFLAKPAQTAILAIFFGAILTLIGLYVKRGNLKTILPRFILAGILIFCINSPGLFQVFLDFSEMMRFTPSGPVEGNAAIALESYKSQIEFKESINYLFFVTKKVAVGHPWIGPIALFSFFASFFFMAKVKDQFAWVVKSFLAITIFTIIIAFGKELPSFWIHYYTPLLNKIRESSRFLFITNISITVLIAYLLHLISNHWVDEKYQKLAMSLILFSGLTLTLQIYFSKYAYALIGIALIVTACISYFIYKNRNIKLFYLAIIFAMVSYSFILPNGLFGKLDNSGFNHIENLASHNILRKASKEIKDIRDYRLSYHDTELKDGQWSNSGLFYNLRSLQGTIVVIPSNQYEELWHSDHFLNYRLFWGCKYHLYNNNEAQPRDAIFKEIVSTKKHSIYSHKDALPRVYFSKKIKLFDKDWKGFRKMLEKQKKVNAVSYLDQNTINSNPILNDFPTQIDNKLISYKFHDNKFVVKTSQNQKGLLVFNEYYSDKWKAKINNEHSELLKINVNQMGIILPSGENTVQLEYKPTAFLWFRRFQKIAFLVILILAFYEVYRVFNQKSNSTIHTP